MRIYLTFMLIVTSSTLLANTSQADPNPDPRTIIGFSVHNEPMTYKDITTLDPVCKLILSTFAQSGYWYPVLKNTGLLEQPLYHMAQGAGSLHHWCYGNIAYYRATRSSSARMRVFYLERSAAEYKFMIEKAEFHDQNWPYVADMYADYGDALFRLDKNPEAISALLTSISMKPKLLKPYIALADHMKRMGNMQKALEYATEGLRHIPQSKALQNRYKALGGKLPFPSPYETTPDPIINTQTNDIPTDVRPQHTNPPEDTNAAPSPPPSNPYCKFCP